MVLPDMYGSSKPGDARIVGINRLESSAMAYTGVLATLLLAPLAFASVRHRRQNVLWLLLGFVGASWVLNVPGIVSLLRLPPLNFFSHNRLLFATSFSILSLAVVGFSVLWDGGVRRRRWFWLPCALLAGLAGWCVYRSVELPEPVATQLAATLERGGTVGGGVSDVSQVLTIQRTFSRHYALAAGWCGVGAAAWLFLALGSARAPRVAPVLGCLVLVELLGFARGLNPNADPALYYPEIPVLAELARAPPGRILGMACLPPKLNESHGLRDIRGYDGVDPARLMDLLDLAADENSAPVPYALTQFYEARGRIAPPREVELSPVLDMLNVRYLVIRGTPPPEYEPLLAEQDYWVLENEAALPRVFVPRRTEFSPDAKKTLRRLGSRRFDPLAVAFLEDRIALPDQGEVRGEARIVEELPRRLEIEAEMETPGLVVLSDLWDAGWHASVDGRSVPVLRVNHALRGVVVPSGRSTIVYHYQPAGLTWGLRASLIGLVAILAWSGACVALTRAEAA